MSSTHEYPWTRWLLLGSWAFLSAGCGSSNPSSNDTSSNLFAFLHPIVFSESARERLDDGEVILRALPGETDEIAVLAAIALETTGELLRGRVEDIAEFKKSSRVLAIRRFSCPPSIEDLRGLHLDAEDLEDIPECRPGDCGLKLAASEIEVLQRAWKSGGDDRAEHVQRAFRNVLLERARSYLEGGLEALPPYHDSDLSVAPQPVFASALSQLTFFYRGAPRFAAYLEHYPKLDIPEVESFLYWSKEQLGRKTSITVTHVGIVGGDPDRGEPEILVAGKQIFSTHYTNGSIGLTMLFRGKEEGPHYLVYVNRSRVDFLSGFWGPLLKALVENRFESAAAEVMKGLKERIERTETTSD